VKLSHVKNLWSAAMQREPTDDGAAGSAWWNALSENERAYWAKRAESARPADAWRVYERSWREAEAMPGEAGTLADEIALIIARAREAGIDDETIIARLQNAADALREGLI
jgi:hypothetical protein